MTRYQVFIGAPSQYDPWNPNPGSARWLTSTFTTPHVNHSDIPPLSLQAASARISTLCDDSLFKSTDESNVVQTDVDVKFENACHVTASRTIDAIVTQDSCSYDFSDASSVANFPAFHFNLHSLSTIGSLIKHKLGNKLQDPTKTSRTVNLLAAILEIRQHDTVVAKRGSEAGKEVALLKMIIGDDSGAICKLTAWRDVAEVWSGVSSRQPAPRAKKGDIVYLENILVSSEVVSDGTMHIACSASPHLRSQLQVCFRAMPSTIEDGQFRPDLRVGMSDAVVRRVASVVGWFEETAGISNSF